jgi:cobalt-zinc-cadmium efflux system protein
MHIHGSTAGPRLWISLGITLAFVIGEAIAGYIGNSLALLSDAGHNASDALALGLAAYAVWVANKPADRKKTYGYHRVSILSAFANAVTLIVIGILILVEAFEFFRNPHAVNGNLMMWVAGVSVLMNTIIAWMLSNHAKSSLNMRATFIHMAGDALSALAVVIAGLVVKQTGWLYADPVVSTLIAIFILYSSWGIVKDSTNILLESSPKGLDIEEMVRRMRLVPNVKNVHDLHVWTVSDGMNYLSCHVAVTEDQSMKECCDLINNLNALLAKEFGIAHATIQTEIEGMCIAEAERPLFCDESTPSR